MSYFHIFCSFLNLKFKILGVNGCLQHQQKITMICMLSGVALTGCATKTLITKDSKTYTRTERVMLVEDNVVAFGRPAQASANLPKDSIVIAGQKTVIS